MILKEHVRETLLSVKEEIDRDPLQKKSITTIERDALLNRNVLQKGFRILYGTSVMEYMKLQRMEKARGMLETGKYTVKYVAKQCGYKSQSNFSAAFKKVTGKTPTECLNEFA